MAYQFSTEDVNTDYFTDNNALGGSGGVPFTFIKLDEGAQLKRIKVWKNPRTIRGVEVWMTDGSRHLVGKRDGNPKEFSFESGELITRLNIKTSEQERWINDKSWEVSMDHRLGAIEFETNTNRKWEISALPKFLLKDGEYQPDVGSGICCGIFGSAYGEVDRLGFAMLRKTKQAILTNVKYPNLASATKTVKVVGHLNRFSNSSNIEKKFTMTSPRAVNVTREWSLSITIPLSLPVTVYAGIPLIKEAEGKNEWSHSKAGTYSLSQSTPETTSWSLECPPQRRIVGEATLYEDKISTEYEGDLELYLDNGEVYRYKEKGIYEGLNVRSGKVTQKDDGPCLEKNN